MKKWNSNSKILVFLLVVFSLFYKSSGNFCISCSPGGDGDTSPTIKPNDATGGTTAYIVPEANVNPQPLSGFSVISTSAPAEILVPITFIGLIFFLITEVAI